MNPISKLLTVFCACALFVGCGPAANEEITAIEKTPDVVKGSQPNSPVASKPAAPLKFGFQSSPAGIDQPVGIELTVELTQQVSGTVEIRVHTDPGLELNEGASAILALEDVGVPGQHSITVTPTAEGLYYVHVFGRLTDDSGLDMGKSYAIPVQVGESTERPATVDQKGEITYDLNNQPVQSLPAEEKDTH